MAKKDLPEMVRITLNTSNLQDRDSAGNPLRTYKGVLKDLDSDLRAFERVLQSATNSFDFFNSNLKRIDTKSGLAEQSFYIRREEFDNAYKALKAKSAELASRRGGDYAFGVHAVENIEMTKTIYGKRAQKKAMEEVDRLGGVATVNASNPDKLDISIPYDKSALTGLNKRQRSALVSQAIPEAMKLSDIERDQRKKEELARLSEEEMERTMQEVEAVKSQKLAEDKAKQDAEKLLEKVKKDEEREEKEKKARTKSNARKVLSVVKTVGATLIIIADIVRRILTATLKSASENEKKAMEAHSVGVTATQRRNLDLFDIAHGMEKGTSFGAIQSVQSLFGNITSLDEKALSTLACVMGSEISDLVTSGMGGKNPDQLLDKILDKYFSQYLSGKNSLGQSVGREEARRELITSLQSVSPEIAKVFARMVDDYASGYYKPFSNSKGWKDTVLLNRTGLTEADLDFNTELGKQYNEIIAIVNDLKDGFFKRLGNSMNGLIKDIKNIRIGYSGEENIEQDKRNREASLRTKAKLEEQLSIYNASAQTGLDMISSVDYTPTIYNKNKVKDFKYSAEILARLRTGTLTKEYLEANLASTGMKSIKEMNTYKSRGYEVLANAKFNTDVFDEILFAIVNLNRLKEIEKDIKAHKIGSGKVKDLSMTRAEQIVEAEKSVKTNAENAYIINPNHSPDLHKKLVSAYFELLVNNRSEYESTKSQMSKADKKKLNQALENIAKEKSIKVDDLSEEEQILAFAKLKADEWYRTRIVSSNDSTAKNYYNKHVLDEAKESLNRSNSAILGQLAGLSVSASAGNYQVVGKQGQSGEYIVYLQSVDSKGNKGSLIKILDLSDTQANTGFLGSATVGADGNITLNESQ